MQLRLAFAVAAHLEPEILLIDEVLAVGDAEFQKKCIGKMEEVSKEHGRTVLFVSHDMQAISTLTQKAIYLREGQVAFIGSTTDAIQKYLSDFNTAESVYTAAVKEGRPCITAVSLATSLSGNVQENGKEIKICLDVEMPGPMQEGIAIAVQIKDFKNRNVLHLSAIDHDKPICRKKGLNKIEFVIPALKMYSGKYMIDVHMSQRPSLYKYETIKDICPFEVVLYEKKHGYKWEDGMCAYLEDYTFQSL
jgi:lipopolysaccharide transport system ATP-binding protein